MTGTARKGVCAASLAALVVIAMGAHAAVAGAPVPLLPGEAALIRGGVAESGDCDTYRTTLHRCIAPDSCDGSLATNCNGSCKGACTEAGIWTDNYMAGTSKKADTDCGNEFTGASCTKITPKNSDPFCGCLNGMDSGAAGTCGIRKGWRSCG